MKNDENRGKEENIYKASEDMEKEYYAHLPMSNLKSKIRSMQKGHVKERDKRHMQDEINDLTARIDTLDQMLKLFPE